jgi:hypothetical protein
VLEPERLEDVAGRQERPHDEPGDPSRARERRESAAEDRRDDERRRAEAPGEKRKRRQDRDGVLNHREREAPHGRNPDESY